MRRRRCWRRRRRGRTRRMVRRSSITSLVFVRGLQWRCKLLSSLHNLKLNKLVQPQLKRIGLYSQLN
jgi:hypothetical protein